MRAWDEPRKPSVLLYLDDNGSHQAWLFTTTDEQHAGYLGLFRLFNSDRYVFYGDATELPKRERAWYNEACEGNAESAFRLLSTRRGAEYEGFEIVPLAGR